MAVWRDHTMKISEGDAHDMEEALQRVADRVMGGRDKYVITKSNDPLIHIYIGMLEMQVLYHFGHALDLKGLINCKKYISNTDEV